MNQLARAKPVDRADPVARARELAAELDGAADEIEATRRIPEPLLTHIHEARLFRMLLPRVYGGDEVHPGTYMAALEEVSRHDASVGWNLFVGNSSTLITPFIAPEAAREIYANPRAAISWGPVNECTLKVVDGGYRVSGTWHFSSCCRQATWMGAHGHVVEPDGSLRLNAAGRPHVGSALMPVEQVTLLDTWNTIGLRGTASDSYTIDDVFVPQAFIGTREDQSLRQVAGTLYAFPQMGLYPVGMSGVALGCARGMLDAFVELCATKTPRGLSRLAEEPLVQAGVARQEARLGSARAYLVETLAEVYERAAEVHVIEVADRARVRLACSNLIHAAIEVADFVYKQAGVNSIFPGSSPFERRFRDMHTLSQQIQARDAHFEAVGKVLLGVPPDVFV